MSGIDIGTFDSSTRSYSAQVTNSVTQTIVTPTVSSTGATYIIKLDGVVVTDGTVSLAVGTNVITVDVTAADRQNTRTYTVTVVRDAPDETDLSSDATLSALSMSGIDFGTFDPAITSYTASVANSVPQTTVVAATNNPQAHYVIKLGGVEAADAEISLEVGENIISLSKSPRKTERRPAHTPSRSRAQSPIC